MRHLLFSLLLVALVAPGARAFDNQRRGFMLGVGMGASYGSYKLVYVVEDPGMPPAPTEFARDEKAGFAIDFRMGGGVTDRVMVFFLSRQPWFSNPVSRSGGSITAGITALGATYSFRTEPGGPYVLGGLGLASWSDGFPVGSPQSWWGFGAIAGVGWELKPHFPLELTVQWGKPTSEEFGYDTSADTLTGMITVSVLLY